MTIQRHFQAMVSIPANSELTTWQAEFMRGTKQNMDLLTGANGETYTAIVRGDVTVQEVSSEEIGQAFDATDYARMVTRVNLLTSALNRLISDIN